MKGPLDWEREFIGKLNDEPSGRKAWAKLGRAEIGDFAKFLLYQFYAFGASMPTEISKGLGKINPSLEKLRYADLEARERQDDPRGEVFRERRERAFENAAKKPWPFRNEQVKTTADAAVTFSPFGMLPPDGATAIIGDGRQTLERYEGKTLLVVLRAGAKARVVNLSLIELSELAYAAGESADPLDKNTLQRFFALPDIVEAERAWQRHFEASEEWDLLAIAEAVKQEISQKLK